MRELLIPGTLVLLLTLTSCEEVDATFGGLTGPTTMSRSSVCRTADNLVTNCGFDSGTIGWEPLNPTSWRHVTDDGASGRGTIEIVHEPEDHLSRTTVRQCISGVSPNTTYRFGGSLRVVEGAPDSCLVYAVAVATADCSGPLPPGVEGQSFNPSTAWIRSPAATIVTNGPGGTTDDVRSILLTGHCIGYSTLHVRFDDFFLEAERAG